MINWRSVEIDGFPKDKNVGYLVSEGNYIEFSDIDDYTDRWIGGSVYALYSEVSGTEFDFHVKFWCPVSELNLPK